VTLTSADIGGGTVRQPRPQKWGGVPRFCRMAHHRAPGRGALLNATHLPASHPTVRDAAAGPAQGPGHQSVRR
jgi:hypothetical protein